MIDMKTELDEKLCKAFPKIFAQRNLPMTQTCMCWGFSCEDGWYDLIYDLCEKIQKHCDEKGIQVEAVQVKEKYGTLRFYVSSADDEVYDLINKAEERSGRICQRCGTDKNITQTEGYWVSFYCDDCHKK
jgi:hypothetical protein